MGGRCISPLHLEKFAAIKNVQKLKGYCRGDWFQSFWILNSLPLLFFS